jgi:hypothetical protein
MPASSSCVVTEADQRLDGRWVNDVGSVLTLTVHDDGRVSGSLRLGRDGSSYRPHRIAASYLRRPDGSRGIVGSVVGWPSNAVITVWCGEFDTELEVLETSWLTTTQPGPVTSCAASVGGEVFRRLDRVDELRSA